MNAIDTLLNRTSGQHGFWLINHKGMIEESLQSMLTIYGMDTSIEMINNIDSKIVKDMYATIKSGKAAAEQAIINMCPIDPQEALMCEACQ